MRRVQRWGVKSLIATLRPPPESLWARSLCLLSHQVKPSLSPLERWKWRVKFD
jgi:hypothetical protein